MNEILIDMELQDIDDTIFIERFVQNKRED